MPRRMIDSAMSTDEKLARLSLKAQFLWPWLIPHCSDQGRMLADPLKIKLTVVPGVNDITWQDVEAILQEYATAGMAILYAAGQVAALQIVNWWKHQHMQWAYPDPLPAPDGWRDRLRYRKDGKVITENWIDADSEPLPNALGKGIGKAEPSAKVSYRSRSSSSINSKSREEQEPAAAPRKSSPDHDPIPEIQTMHLLVNSYQRGNGWRETDTVPSIDKPTLRNMIDEGYQADDIEGCTKWLLTDDFWAKKTVTLPVVYRNLPKWIADGRPIRAPDKPNGTGPSPGYDPAHTSPAIAAFKQFQQMEAQNGSDDHADPGRLSSGLPAG